MHRNRTTAVVLIALAGGALALAAQPERQSGQRGQRDPSQIVERMMERDANGDGKLQRDELPPQLAERFFESGDANNDGALDREELTAIMAQRGQPGGGQPNFEGSMRQAGRALAGLRRSEFNGESMARDLQTVQHLQQALLGAKGTVTDAPRSEQAQEKYADDDAYFNAMRINLLKALQESIALEIAIIQGREGAATESVGKITELQDAAHTLFQPEDHEPPEERGRRSGGAAGGGG